MPQILSEGLKKITIEGMAETYDKYTRGSNPVKYFVEKGLTYEIGSKVTKLDLYDHYEKFCREFGFAIESQQSFSRKLKDEGFNVKRGRIKGEQVYCWLDILPKDWKKEEQDIQDKLEDFSDATREAMK